MPATNSNEEQQNEQSKESQTGQHEGGSKHVHQVTDPQQSRTVTTETHQKHDQQPDQNAPKR